MSIIIEAVNEDAKYMGPKRDVQKLQCNECGGVTNEAIPNNTSSTTLTAIWCIIKP
jgi:hypothetical protein